MERQYAAVQFKPNGRTYIYHFDGPELFIGDRVTVNSFDGKGLSRVTVVSVSTDKPEYPTKAIVGRVEDIPEPNAAEIARCKAANIVNIINGTCTTCEKPQIECYCLPF